jgi:hypothetical protein
MQTNRFGKCWRHFDLIEHFSTGFHVEAEQLGQLWRMNLVLVRSGSIPRLLGQDWELWIELVNEQAS